MFDVDVDFALSFISWYVDSAFRTA